MAATGMGSSPGVGGLPEHMIAYICLEALKVGPQEMQHARIQKALHPHWGHNTRAKAVHDWYGAALHMRSSTRGQHWILGGWVGCAAHECSGAAHPGRTISPGGTLHTPWGRLHNTGISTATLGRGSWCQLSSVLPRGAPR
jgi:hypothetical protein